MGAGRARQGRDILLHPGLIPLSRGAARSMTRASEQQHRRRAQEQRARAGKKHQLRTARIEQPARQQRPDRRSEVDPRIDEAVDLSPRVRRGHIANDDVAGGLDGADEKARKRHGDDGFLVAAMRHDAPIAGGEGACGGPDAGREGGLDQGRAEPAIALAGAPGAVLAGTLVVAVASAPGGSWGGRRPSLGDYVIGVGPTEGSDRRRSVLVWPTLMPLDILRLPLRFHRGEYGRFGSMASPS